MDELKINISHILDEYRKGALRLKKPQVKLLNALSKHTISEYARISKQKYHYLETRLQEIFNFAESKWVAPANGLFKAIPNSQTMKKASIYYSIDPETWETKPRWYWIKAEQEWINPEDIIQYCKETIKPLKPVPLAYETTIPDCLTLYTLTDYHLGMMAWEEEGGMKWNLEIAEETFKKWLEYQMANSLPTDEAVFANIGDFLHFDGMLPVTPASKHVLDASNRYGEIVRVAIRCIKLAVETLQQKHKHITFIMAEGNHDEASSIWLREAFNVMYSNNDKVTFINDALPFYSLKFWDNGLYFHHGHKVKMQNIALTMADYFPELHGQTKNRFVFLWHYHHDKVQEGNGYKVMQLRTLAPNDAYSIRWGWKSQQDTKTFIFHKEHGLLQTITTPFNLLK